jgi:putative two-component system hydrogenase maturation factor HypX/HoxX
MHGSDYWTYVLPRRVGAACASRLIEQGLPTLAREARQLGLADRLLPEDWNRCERDLDRLLGELTEPASWARALSIKERQRQRDERSKPLQKYRDEELLQVHHACFDLDSDFHAAGRSLSAKTGTDTESTLPMLEYARAG